MIMVNIPLALVGAVLGLWLSGQPLSVAALVGFITLGRHLCAQRHPEGQHYINLMRLEGEDFDQKMILRGSLERLAPVLMTALVTAFALAPLLFEAEQPRHRGAAPGGGRDFLGADQLDPSRHFLTPAMFWLFGRESAERLMDTTDVEAL